MGVYVAPTVPYRHGQCPQCAHYAPSKTGQGRCHGFAAAGYGGLPMLAVFEGESAERCHLLKAKPGSAELVALIERVKAMDDSAWSLTKAGTKTSVDRNNPDEGVIYFLRAIELVKPDERTPLGTPLTVTLEENLKDCAAHGTDVEAIRQLYTSTFLTEEARCRFLAEKEAAQKAEQARRLQDQEARNKYYRNLGRCVECYKPLGILEKIFRWDTHQRCARHKG